MVLFQIIINDEKISNFSDLDLISSAHELRECSMRYQLSLGKTNDETLFQFVEYLFITTNLFSLPYLVFGKDILAGFLY